MQAVCPAPLHAAVNVLISLLDGLSVFGLDHRIVHRNADMVESHAGDAADILFRDKGIKVLLRGSVKLREPAAEVDTPHVTIHASHINPPPRRSS